MPICKYCQAQIDAGFTYVKGWGNNKAHFLLLGEAPGKAEDAEGLPFIGRSGLLLNKRLGEVGLARSSFYITNAVRCRPDEKNSNPGMKWIRECRDVCLKETLSNLHNLECIICLGAIPLKSITDTGQISLIKSRRKVFMFNHIPTVCTFHPSYILRNPVARDWMVADMESYLLDRSFIRNTPQFDYTVIEEV